jgi:hypothetical protein
VEFPPYAYVPGHWPHPVRDPQGHAYGREEVEVPALDPAAWREDATWCEGIELFDHGYYWEAHEAWERLWIAAGRTGVVGDLLSGLIKLAAAGIKIRQGMGPQAAALGARAVERFERAQAGSGAESLAGLRFEDLRAIAGEATGIGDVDATGAERVRVVFEGRLRPP